MSKYFSPNTLFRQTSPAQLQGFFRCFGKEVTYEHNPKRPLPRRVQDITPFVSAYETFDAELRSEIDQQIANISALATVDGIHILGELAPKYHYEHWLVVFRKGDSNYHKVIDVWSHRRDMFDQALEILKLKKLKRAGVGTRVPTEHPDFTPELIEKLKEEIKHFFMVKEKRGNRCYFDMMETVPGSYAFVVCPDDYERTYFKNTNGEELLEIRETYAFKLALLYNSNAGTLEITGDISPRRKKELEDLFIRTVFNIELEPKSSPEFCLSGLHDRKFNLPAQPEQGLSVTVEEIAVKWLEKERTTRLIIGPKNDNMPDTLSYNYHGDKERRALKDGDIVAAFLTFSFESRPGRRAKKVKVDIDRTNQKLNIRTGDIECQKVITDYLTKLEVFQ